MILGSQKAQAFVVGVLLSAYLFTTFRARSLESLSERIAYDNVKNNLPQSLKNGSKDNLNVTRTSEKILFAKSASRFVEVFFGCLFDQNCHVLYHHVQKTGGTFLASTFYPILNQQPYQSHEWCCTDVFIQSFHTNFTEYCDKRLGVYEVMGSQFEEVVETCHAYYNNQTKSHRAIALVTVREPVERIVSSIHQGCNKGYNQSSPEMQAICRQCSYHKSAVHWDGVVKSTNQVYAELNYELPIDWLVLDSLMIDRFLQLLEKRLPVPIQRGESNEEKKDICDFHVPSGMFKKLIPAKLAYQKVLMDADPDAMGWP